MLTVISSLRYFNLFNFESKVLGMVNMAVHYEKSPENFLRDIGITQEKFKDLLNKIIQWEENVKSDKPMKKRGLKEEKGSAEVRLLLTFRYLRHYPTFARLGEEFEISESYANKIFHRMLKKLLEVEHLGSKEELLDPSLDTIVVDVTEQQIERPKKGQKAYYSGKKRNTL